MNGKYIVIEGNIGAGKTSLAKKLAVDLGGVTILEEFADNTFLPQFYRDPKKFAFPLELSFLAARYQQLSRIKDDFPTNLFIADYHFEKSLLFARINLTEPEFQLYESFFKIMDSLAPTPDLVVFLDKSVPSLKQNITSRNREFEKDITEEYLQIINENYRENIENFAKSDFLRIDSNRLDFIHNLNHYEFIFNRVSGKL